MNVKSLTPARIHMRRFIVVTITRHVCVIHVFRKHARGNFPEKKECHKTNIQSNY